jgi:plastocyanin
LSDKLNAKTRGKGPFIVGLLNALMPCAPLLSMQLYALGTGSALVGGVSMLLFSLGTVPLMLAFGCAGAFTGKKTKRIMTTVSSVLVAVMGFFMFTSGFALTGITFGGGGGASVEATDGGGIQKVSSTVTATKYGNISVKAGTAVDWTLNADASVDRSCIRDMRVPEFNISKRLKSGVNKISFTPTKKGTYIIRCSMGMYTGRITVT